MTNTVKLDYNFKVGDKVITTFGEVGRITSVCTCDSCARRGFYEPTWVEDISGDIHYITISDAVTGFGTFYQIGEYKFCSLFNKQFIEQRISDYEKELKMWKYRMSVIEELERGGTLDD